MQYKANIMYNPACKKQMVWNDVGIRYSFFSFYELILLRHWQVSHDHLLDRSSFVKIQRTHRLNGLMLKENIWMLFQIIYWIKTMFYISFREVRRELRFFFYWGNKLLKNSCSDQIIRKLITKKINEKKNSWKFLRRIKDIFFVIGCVPLPGTDKCFT